MSAKQIIHNLYLGDQYSCPNFCNHIISAAAEIFETEKNNESLNLKTNYFYTNNQKRLVINLLDYASKNKIDEKSIILALKFINQNIETHPIYIHCLFGVNRSATITFIYLVIKNKVNNNNFETAVEQFKKIYPKFSPNPGYYHYLQTNFPYTNLKVAIDNDWNR